MTGDDRLPVATARAVLRESGRALGRLRWSLLPLVIVLIAAAAAGIVPPLVLGAVVDTIDASASSGARGLELWPVAALLVAAVVVGSVLAAAGFIATAGLFERMLAELRERMVEAVFRLPQSRIERAGTGDVIARAGDDVAQVSGAIPRVVPALTGALFTIAVTLVGMAALDPWYALAVLVVVPVHILAIRVYLRTAPGVYADERAAMASRAQHLLDALRGIETLRAFRLTRHHLDRIADASWAVVRLSMMSRIIQNRFFAHLNVAELLGLAALLCTGFALVATGVGSLGGATAAALLFLRLFGPINQLLFVIDDLQSALASIGRIVGVIVAGREADDAATGEGGADRAAGAADRASAAWRITAVGGVRLRRVHHSYRPGHPVLADIDLTLERGKVAALVGASGAGKSTLASLVAGIHPPDRGDVERPERITLVTQETHVFDDTLRANLTLAAPGVSDSELRDALERVEARHLLHRVGLDGVVGASGETLSPADVQRVALARVLLADPHLVILDEATAESGSREAGSLDRAAAEVLRGRTGLVVAHRLAQASDADVILVMEGGAIVERGSHSDLLAAGGRYARLWGAWEGPATTR